MLIFQMCWAIDLTFHTHCYNRELKSASVNEVEKLKCDFQDESRIDDNRTELISVQMSLNVFVFFCFLGQIIRYYIQSFSQKIRDEKCVEPIIIQ